MRSEEKIKEFIKEIENGDTVGKDNYAGLVEITSKGDAWIEALKGVLEQD